jgi:tRNA A-37 threonylcarbamoyl transferase component Bud32
MSIIRRVNTVEGTMLSETIITQRIETNTIEAFKTLHSYGVCHGDVRAANILVRNNEIVVLIDFERSMLNADKMMLVEEEDEVRHMLAFVKSKS